LTGQSRDCRFDGGCDVGYRVSMQITVDQDGINTACVKPVIVGATLLSIVNGAGVCTIDPCVIAVDGVSLSCHI
jgi:hypothetical protein